MGVVTINMPRIAYQATDEADFYARLDHLMDLAARSLKTKRTVITKLLDAGLYPYTKRYLGTFDNHFSTIGLVGMNEACLNAADDFVVSAGRNGSPEDGVGPAVRYAILYLGCIQEMDGAYNDAMITVFGEKGSASAYSAFTLVKGMGQGENFMWSDPEPAGEEQLLL